jgi:predicted permease
VSPSRPFKTLLKALPTEFRKRHHAEIEHLLTSYAGEKTGFARIITTIRAALDIAWVAVALRMKSTRNRKSKGANMQRRPTPRTAIDSIVQDLRYAFRTLRRDASLAIFATLIVGLGVGASVTVFSVANALLLRALPFQQPEELVWISNGEWGRGQQLSALTVQVAHLQDLRAESEQLTDVAGYSQFDRSGDHTIAGAGNPERLTRLRVTENFFQLLGVAPVHGRLFTAEEVQYGGPRVVLLDHGFWIRRFSGDPAVLGRSIVLNDEPATVVGILPASFDFAGIFSPENPVDFVAPFPLSEETNRQGNTLALIGRLAPGASLEVAGTEASLIASRPTPDRRNDFTPHMVPLHEHVSGQFRSAIVVLIAAVALVMLIVCANLSNLLLARGTLREKEVAVRGALGASRIRLLRQLLTESLILASGGTFLGLAFAFGGTTVLAQLDINIPLLNQVRVDPTVLVFTLAVAVVTGVVFGVMPALRLSALAPQEALNDSSRSATHGRQHGWVRGTLVVAEVAAACVLLIGAGLVLRSLWRVMDVDLGFQPQSAVSLRINPGTRPPTHEQRVALYDEALRRVRAAPGVDAAGTTDVLPTAFNRRWCLRGNDCAVVPFVRVVSEDYIDAMGLSLISGRDFTAGDHKTATPVIIINEETAEALWPGQEPIGRTIEAHRGTWEAFTVIGVVRGMRHLTPEQVPGPEMFFSFRQMPDFGAVHLIARSSQRLDNLTSTIRGALTSLDPNLPVDHVRPIQEIIDGSLAPRRFVALLLAGFAAFAVLLASLGIYGVISYSVNQRQREMGIRLALGATTARLHRGMLAETLRLAAAGLVLGLVAAWMLARSIQGLLYGVQPFDPLTFVATPIALLAVAALAGHLPARRATKLDPVTALRTEG